MPPSPREGWRTSPGGDRVHIKAITSVVFCLGVRGHRRFCVGAAIAGGPDDCLGTRYPGVIPNRTTICTTLNASSYGSGTQDASAAIQTAVNACPLGQVVQLHPYDSP